MVIAETPLVIGLNQRRFYFRTMPPLPINKKVGFLSLHYTCLL